jgi:serine phosphatase RsbU (regulator of sigma subunit)
MPYLIVVSGSATGRRYPIDCFPFVLGRRPDCRLCELFTGDGLVSRRHAEIRCDAGTYVIQDLESANGTRLNGLRIRGQASLKQGDCITIGSTELTFSVAPPEEAEPNKVGVTSSRDVVSHVDRREMLASVPVVAQARGEPPAHDAARRLAALVALLSKLGQTLDVEATLAHLLEGLFELFPNADQGFVGLRTGAEGTVQPRAAQARGGRSGAELHVSRTVIDHVLSTASAIISADARLDERFQASRSLSNANIRSFLCAPLFDGEGGVQGVVEIESLDGAAPFQRADLELLASLAPHVSLAVNYARMHAEALQQQALEHDLQLARQVQLGLLPEGPPQVDGYEFHAVYETAHQVGGDFFDYLRLPQGRIAVVAADVAGKGISAALLAAKAAAELKYLLSSEAAAGQALARLNDTLCAADIAGRFVTVAVAILDPSRHEVACLSAGHPAPLLRKADGTTTEVGTATRGPAIGMFPGRSYAPAVAELAAGDVLVLFTDGVSEANNRGQELYGPDRLREQVSRGPAAARALIEAVREDVRRFVDGHQQSDDLCLVGIHRL